jgi:hypothetical protein
MSNAGRQRLRLFSIGLCASIFLAASSTRSLVVAPTGQNRIVLPLELIAGEPATLAVLTPDGHVAAGVEIVLSSGQVLTTDESGRAHFLVPPQTGALFARLLGSETREAADVLPKQLSSVDLQLTQFPKIASVSDRLVISGSGFSGDADKNSVEIDGKRALVLASSPTRLILMPPADTVLGPARLLIAKGNSEVTANITFVSIVPMSFSEVQIRAGKEATIRLLVQGTTEPLNMEIKNLTPGVAEFKHADTLFARSRGGTDNWAIIRIKGLAAGQLSYSVRLESEHQRGDVPIAVDFLRAAQKAAGPDTRKKINSIVRRLQQEDANWKNLLKELQGIANSSKAGDVEALISAAERSISGS